MIQGSLQPMLSELFLLVDLAAVIFYPTAKLVGLR
jgi:hypothetical protein